MCIRDRLRPWPSYRPAWVIFGRHRWVSSDARRRLGALALICGLISAKAAQFYFWFLGIAYGLDVVTYAVSHWGKISPMTNFLVNLPHTLIFISAFIVAWKVDRA